MEQASTVSASGPGSVNDRESYWAFEMEKQMEDQMEDQTWRSGDAEQLLCSAGVPV